MQFSKIKFSIDCNAFFPIGTFVLALLIVSCENEEEQNMPLEQNQSISLLFEKEAIEKAELKEKLSYKDYHLTKLMEEALRIIPDFDEKSVKKSNKIEGLGTFYFDDLLSKDLVAKGLRATNDSIQFSLKAFTDLEGESWYPYVQKIKEGRGTESLYLINSYDPEIEKEIVKGYKLNDTGQLELKYRDLSEEDIFGPDPIPEALGNDVYVIGISPEEQKYILPEDDNSGSYGGGGGSTSSSWVKLEYVKIKDKKESWLEKADVKFEVVAVTANSLHPGEYSTHCGFNAGLGCYWNGSFLVHCNNSEVGDKRLINRDMGILQTGAFAKIAVYVIFEYDSWPAPTHVYERTLNGETLKVGYRSYQSPYDELTANFHDQNPYNLINGRNLSRNNTDIEYNLK
ncbi:MAG: hypothetical protein VX798_05580 [Bacteroidota bacterium]|uniref:Uncharacterized protein n=1 Tax=Flagellimonas profundi TaxID=2915620 RepID=A0ABS3FFR0_9FLAO|nr:hypothetical protein [Allomuricauda profundi]MBO0341903.1 hypothetical protein [Allomuricauda profundi]MEC7770634.1 hypothetical protein [Bacteroidota bacterium]